MSAGADALHGMRALELARAAGFIEATIGVAMSPGAITLDMTAVELA